jgi:hypothetical protein
MVFITKIDTPHDVAELKKVEDYLKNKKWPVEKTSSKQNINVQESFEKLIKKTLDRKYGIEDIDNTNNAKVD